MVNTHKRGFAATFHQRHAGSITVALIEQVIEFLHQHYDAVWLSVSEETVPELKEAIRSNQQCTAIFIPAKGAADARRRLVFAAQHHLPALDSLHICDFDRVVTWMKTYPEELVAISKKPLPANTYCILGRTARAFASHPQTWQRTERLINEIAADFFQIEEVDIAAGSALFPISLIPILLKNNNAHLNDGEWPRNVQRSGGTIVYQACDGLRFEERNKDPFEHESAFQLMQRLQVAAIISESFFTEGM